MHSKLRIVSLNGNKRAQSTSSAAVDAWVRGLDPDVLMVQEPCARQRSPLSAWSGMTLLTGTSSLAAYARPGLGATVVREEDRWVTLTTGEIRVHGVYFPSDKGEARARAAFLERLCGATAPSPSARHVVVGDFNLAPRPEDGRLGGRTSPWTTVRERQAYATLLSKNDLHDLGATMEAELEFTLERQLATGLSRFRCDLALVDATLARSSATRLTVDHTLRRGDRRYTDHSALVLHLPTAGASPATRAATPSQNSSVAMSGGAAPQKRLNPGNTAIRRNGQPSKPAASAHRALLVPGMSVLDYGCGHGGDVQWLEQRGFDVVGYDNCGRFKRSGRPLRQFDLVLMTYVVNVLPRTDRETALYDAWQFVKRGGALFVASRTSSEIEKGARTGGWERHDDGYISSPSKGTFQHGFSSKDLLSLCAGLPGADASVPPWVTSHFAGVLARRG